MLHKVHCLQQTHTTHSSAPAQHCVLIFALIQPHIVPFPSVTLYMVIWWVFCSCLGVWWFVRPYVIRI